jgi:hypothetical protein
MMMARVRRKIFLALQQKKENDIMPNPDAGLLQSVQVVGAFRGEGGGSGAVQYTVLRMPDGRLLLAVPLDRELREAAATLSTLRTRKTLRLSPTFAPPLKRKK